VDDVILHIDTPKNYTVSVRLLISLQLYVSATNQDNDKIQK